MQINFFEECIDGAETDLANARLITWPATIYIAAKSLSEFEDRRNLLFSINPELSAAYWPILPNSYWISPFADPDELDTLRNELIDYRGSGRYEGTCLSVLLDLELPILKPSQFARNAFSYFSNRKRVRRLLHLKKENISLVTAEYWYAIGWAKFLTMFGGVTYSNNQSKHTRLIMYYSSTLKQNGVVKHSEAMNYMKIALTKEAARDKGVQAALGTTSIGILGDEIRMTPQELEYDLELLTSAGFKEATIFRLAGIKPYLEIVEKYVNR